ncbi:BadF/BadG/BcrA/BcrD ATPase family protein [Chitinivorax sp. PXF-14]|uniref:BadF/BadG/BcrA/BcrD ATPase family protein n=1 Tax=Chitinivorax sp. PXF-14 TaxID=3230488 RepID=UPI003466EA67
MHNTIHYLIGIDGGGTRTRIQLADPSGRPLAYAECGPSALGQGVDKAWREIATGLDAVFAQLKVSGIPFHHCAVGAGLSGVNNASWARHFHDAAPAFAALSLASDAYTALLGAHDGGAGAIVIVGTGSIGLAQFTDGRRVETGGWGFPSGDEASGAWLGLHAIALAQRTLDGRASQTAFTRELIAQCGGSDAALLDWLGRAGQAEYATLAPVVVRHAQHDVQAQALMQRAGQEIAAMARAMDADEALPLALCGGLSTVMADYLPDALKVRTMPPRHDAVYGALLLAKQAANQSS